MDRTVTEGKEQEIAEALGGTASAAYFPLGFQLRGEVWPKLGLGELLAGAAADDLAGRIRAVRAAAAQLNALQATEARMRGPVSAGQLLAWGLLEDILRYLFDSYSLSENPGIVGVAMEDLRAQVGPKVPERATRAFVELFPPQSVQLGRESPATFLGRFARSGLDQHSVVREIVLLALAVINPALHPFRFLFDDTELEGKSRYRNLVRRFETFFESQAPLRTLGLSLFRALRAPTEASPNSLEGQLVYIRDKWGHFLPKRLLRALLAAGDVLREETLPRGFGPGVLESLRFGRALGEDYLYPEPERFTADVDWMSRVVLIAKVAYVWLHQLSRQYQRSITRLDQVPDEELDLLARRGFTGLWLIGIWERSCASENIKKRMGNPEAAASAYSVYDYVIAGDLGGEEALRSLKERAWRRGIRLAADMVPNHVGIYSRWVIQHPHWFIQSPHPPFPRYRFTGPDLCPEDRVGIFIEDGYWDHSDAAVVFKRVDHWTGETRYIYHGNDGTHMPWNDTAQLNYLMPEVREAVLNTILHVARLFPIIRFDAAMTLSKRHYQRLWFPLPGEGGAIPSRSEFSMTRAEFNAAMPEEFWRQVVDRVNAEAPDTLLMAEAFWLMEGYFVRTLGMHRVYNSAFMNMLKMEDNLKYRMTVKNVLEFSPEILKRFVNFMNNPDELTALEQFGKGDKYFGVAVMMVTMPGLPMFGHGQIEAFAEKYGMEYRRAYWEEQPDEEVVRRHEREVFPLMRRRYLFSGVQHFAFYDFVHREGYVDENVFAYSNRVGDARSLVLYNNAYSTTQGHIHTSTAINRGAGDERDLYHKTLSESLGLRADPSVFYLFRDHRDGMQYVREGRELAERGLFVELRGYQYHVFLDFQEVEDRQGVWRQVAERLGGRGAPDIYRIYREVLAGPMLDAFRRVISPETVKRLAKSFDKRTASTAARKSLEQAMAAFLDVVESETGIPVDKKGVLHAVDRELKLLPRLLTRLASPSRKGDRRRVLFALLPGAPERGVAFWRIPVVWTVAHHLEEIFGVDSVAGSGAAWLQEWLLTIPAVETFVALGTDERKAHEDAQLVATLVRHTPTLLAVQPGEAAYLLEEILEDTVARSYLYVNEFDGKLWLSKEQLETLLGWLGFTSAVSIATDPDLKPSRQNSLIASRLHCGQAVLDAAQKAGYHIEKTLAILADR